MQKKVLMAWLEKGRDCCRRMPFLRALFGWKVRHYIHEKGVLVLFRFVRSCLYEKPKAAWFGYFSRQNDVLYAFYDLKVSPATFDIFSFLILAEKFRCEHTKCTYIHLLIVPGEQDGFRGDGPHSLSNQQWRQANILMPSWRMLPSCKAATLAVSRREAYRLQCSLAKQLFPVNYSVMNPIECYLLKHLMRCRELPSFVATGEALRYVKKWLEEIAGVRKVVVITLRECDYENSRNSNMAEWRRFVDRLDKTVYCPVLVRDIEMAMSVHGVDDWGAVVCLPASWNLEIRVALYQQSLVTLGVSGGTAALSINNKRCNGLVFKMLTPDCGSTCESFFKSMGLDIGGQLPAAHGNNLLVWEDDRCEVIEKHFNALVHQLEFGNSSLGV